MVILLVSLFLQNRLSPRIENEDGRFLVVVEKCREEVAY